jgi:hypothetical protein
LINLKREIETTGVLSSKIVKDIDQLIEKIEAER